MTTSALPMRPAWRCAAAAMLCAGSLAAAGMALPRAAAPIRITAIRAKLFYDDGTFSRDVLSPPAFALWNVIIGEGDAGKPSHSTLVIVEVTGRPNDTSSRVKVELTARDRRQKLLLRHAQEVYLGETGRYVAGFWLYDTGCEPIRLSARTVGQRSASTRTATLDFRCGE